MDLIGIGSIIEIGIVAGMAHCPEVGVNVKTVVPKVVVIIVGGFQLPVIPLVDVPGISGT